MAQEDRPSSSPTPENNPENWQFVAKFLKDLDISTHSFEGKLLITRARHYMKHGADVFHALTQAFPDAITGGQEKTVWEDVVPPNPWAANRKRLIQDTRPYYVPEMEPTTYRFEVHWGSVNGLPVTEFRFMHGENQQTFRRPHPPADMSSPVFNDPITVWAPGIRVVGIGMKGLGQSGERRYSIIPTLPIHGEGIS